MINKVFKVLIDAICKCNINGCQRQVTSPPPSIRKRNNHKTHKVSHGQNRLKRTFKTVHN